MIAHEGIDSGALSIAFFDAFRHRDLNAMILMMAEPPAAIEVQSQPAFYAKRASPMVSDILGGYGAWTQPDV